MTGRTRALAAGGAAAVLAAGLGLGYALFHSSGKSKTPAAAAVAATSSSTPADFTLDGKLTLRLGAFQWNHGNGNPCSGYDGYTDIAAGAPVVITDQGGAVIATGQLDSGTAVLDGDRASACVLTFAVPHVPDRPFYGVTVSHRGTLTYSAAQAKSGDVALSLG